MIQDHSSSHSRPNFKEPLFFGNEGRIKSTSDVQLEMTVEEKMRSNMSLFNPGFQSRAYEERKVVNSHEEVKTIEMNNKKYDEYLSKKSYSDVPAVAPVKGYDALSFQSFLNLERNEEQGQNTSVGLQPPYAASAHLNSRHPSKDTNQQVTASQDVKGATQHWHPTNNNESFKGARTEPTARNPESHFSSAVRMTNKASHDQVSSKLKNDAFQDLGGLNLTKTSKPDPVDYFNLWATTNSKESQRLGWAGDSSSSLFASLNDYTKQIMSESKENGVATPFDYSTHKDKRGTQKAETIPREPSAHLMQTGAGSLEQGKSVNKGSYDRSSTRMQPTNTELYRQPVPSKEGRNPQQSGVYSSEKQDASRLSFGGNMPNYPIPGFNTNSPLMGWQHPSYPNPEIGSQYPPGGWSPANQQYYSRRQLFMNPYQSMFHPLQRVEWSGELDVGNPGYSWYTPGKKEDAVNPQGQLSKVKSKDNYLKMQQSVPPHQALPSYPQKELLYSRDNVHQPTNRKEKENSRYKEEQMQRGPSKGSEMYQPLTQPQRSKQVDPPLPLLEKEKVLAEFGITRPDFGKYANESDKEIPVSLSGKAVANTKSQENYTNAQTLLQRNEMAGKSEGKNNSELSRYSAVNYTDNPDMASKLKEMTGKEYPFRGHPFSNTQQTSFLPSQHEASRYGQACPSRDTVQMNYTNRENVMGHVNQEENRENQVYHGGGGTQYHGQDALERMQQMSRQRFDCDPSMVPASQLLEGDRRGDVEAVQNREDYEKKEYHELDVVKRADSSETHDCKRVNVFKKITEVRNEQQRDTPLVMGVDYPILHNLDGCSIPAFSYSVSIHSAGGGNNNAFSKPKEGLVSNQETGIPAELQMEIDEELALVNNQLNANTRLQRNLLAKCDTQAPVQQNVSYEASTSSIVVKAVLPSDASTPLVKKFPLAEPATLASLTADIVNTVPFLADKKIMIYTIDSEGDNVIIGDDEDLKVALFDHMQNIKQPFFRISVELLDKNSVLRGNDILSQDDVLREGRGKGTNKRNERDTNGRSKKNVDKRNRKKRQEEVDMEILQSWAEISEMGPGKLIVGRNKMEEERRQREERARRRERNNMLREENMAKTSNESNQKKKAENVRKRSEKGGRRSLRSRTRRSKRGGGEGKQETEHEQIHSEIEQSVEAESEEQQKKQLYTEGEQESEHEQIHSESEQNVDAGSEEQQKKQFVTKGEQGHDVISENEQNSQIRPGEEQCDEISPGSEQSNQIRSEKEQSEELSSEREQSSQIRSEKEESDEACSGSGQNSPIRSEKGISDEVGFESGETVQIRSEKEQSVEGGSESEQSVQTERRKEQINEIVWEKVESRHIRLINKTESQRKWSEVEQRCEDDSEKVESAQVYSENEQSGDDYSEVDQKDENCSEMKQKREGNSEKAEADSGQRDGGSSEREQMNTVRYETQHSDQVSFEEMPDKVNSETECNEASREKEQIGSTKEPNVIGQNEESRVEKQYTILDDSELQHKQEQGEMNGFGKRMLENPRSMGEVEASDKAVKKTEECTEHEQAANSEVSTNHTTLGEAHQESFKRPYEDDTLMKSKRRKLQEGDVSVLTNNSLMNTNHQYYQCGFYGQTSATKSDNRHTYKHLNQSITSTHIEPCSKLEIQHHTQPLGSECMDMKDGHLESSVDPENCERDVMEYTNALENDHVECTSTRKNTHLKNYASKIDREVFTSTSENNRVKYMLTSKNNFVECTHPSECTDSENSRILCTGYRKHDLERIPVTENIREKCIGSFEVNHRLGNRHVEGTDIPHKDRILCEDTARNDLLDTSQGCPKKCHNQTGCRGTPKNHHVESVGTTEKDHMKYTGTPKDDHVESVGTTENALTGCVGTPKNHNMESMRTTEKDLIGCLGTPKIYHVENVGTTEKGHLEYTGIPRNYHVESLSISERDHIGYAGNPKDYHVESIGNTEKDHPECVGIPKNHRVESVGSTDSVNCTGRPIQNSDNRKSSDNEYAVCACMDADLSSDDAFTCSHCQTSFPTKRTFLRHLNFAHGFEDEPKCKLCNKSLWEKQS